MAAGAIGELSHGASLRESAEEALTSAIISGVLVPGQVVSVPALAAQFQVSATPVREAMLNLEKKGFVESVRNKGFRITAVEESDLREIVQVRRWLELPAIRLAAAHFPAARLPQLRKMAQRIISSAAKADFLDYIMADTAFHLELVALAGNSRLTGIVHELRDATRLVGLQDMKDTKELEASAEEHLELLELLAAGDADGAEKLLHRHIGHVLGWWAGRPEDSDAEQAPAAETSVPARA